MDPLKLIHNCLSSDNCPNLLLYGIGNIYSILHPILYNSYNISYTNHMHLNGIDIYSSHIHYEINMKQVKNSNSKDFFQFLYNCITAKNHYINPSNRIFILKDFMNIKKIIQNSLRVIIEKYRTTTLFIFLTNRLNSILQPIHSRCLSIRIPDLSRKDKVKLVHGIQSKNKTRMYDLLYDSHTKEDRDSILNCYQGIDCGYQNPFELVIQRINKIINKTNIDNKNIDAIREIAYHILKYNMVLSDFYKMLLCSLITDHKYTSQMKYKLIHLFAESEHNLLKSYKKLIHLESLLLNIHLIIRIEENSH